MPESFLRKHAEKTMLFPPEEVKKLEKFETVFKEANADEIIPAFPVVPARILEEIKDTKIDLNEIERIAKLDSAVLGAIHKSALSASYGGGAVDSVQEAIIKIGIKQLRKIVFSLGFQSAISQLKVAANWDAFWIHSILVARLTEKLHYCYSENNGKEYIAGLLHDSGKLLLQKVFPEPYGEVIKLIADKYTAEQAETVILGFPHQYVSSLLCQKWKMDERTISAVKYHHDATNANLSERDALLAACISVADDLANFCGVNLDTLRKIDFQMLEHSHTWNFLRSFNKMRDLKIDVEKEIEAIKEDVFNMTKAY
jgi:HD-like signal output (HDOD) protein